MAFILLSGLLFWLSGVMFILGAIAAGHPFIPDRYSAKDIWFLSLVFLVIGGSLLIMGQ